MQKFVSLGLSAAAALSLTVALAGTAQAQQPNGTSVQVSGNSYTPSSAEFDDVAGFYKLETGQIIEVSESNNRYYTSLKDKSPVEIFPVKPGVFVSKAGATLTFNDDSGVVVVRQPDLLLRASR